MSYPYERWTWTDGMYEDPDPHNGTVLAHREIASQILGRKLAPTETVHHEDEDKRNNHPSNLRVFRSLGDHAAFHAGADLIDHGDGTFSAARKKKVNKRVSRESHRCATCFVRIRNRTARVCRDCFLREQRSGIPDKEELVALVWAMPITKIALKFGVSDAAVNKWCKQYAIEKPPRGHWLKKSRESDRTG